MHLATASYQTVLFSKSYTWYWLPETPWNVPVVGQFSIFIICFLKIQRTWSPCNSTTSLSPFTLPTWTVKTALVSSEAFLRLFCSHLFMPIVCMQGRICLHKWFTFYCKMWVNINANPMGILRVCFSFVKETANILQLIIQESTNRNLNL